MNDLMRKPNFRAALTIAKFQSENEPTDENVYMFLEGFTKLELMQGYATLESIFALLIPAYDEALHSRIFGEFLMSTLETCVRENP